MLNLEFLQILLSIIKHYTKCLSRAKFKNLQKNLNFLNFLEFLRNFFLKFFKFLKKFDIKIQNLCQKRQNKKLEFAVFAPLSY